MRVPLLARADRWAVVAKPTGLPVHRSKMVNERQTVMRAVKRHFEGHVAPVHRLDRATSGCLLLSLDPAATPVLQRALAAGQKRYLALCRGRAEVGPPVHVDRPMKDERGVLKEASTELRAVAASAQPRCSLWEARPHTGRYHQVRRHVRDLNHPVIGDSTHGDTRVNRWWRDNQGIGRLALHCLSLSLRTEDGEDIDVVCPVPWDLRRVWQKLPWWEEALAAIPELALDTRSEAD